jgi:glucose/arabinose dehydrogenase
MAFYNGQQFRALLNDGFVALHGSWNRSRRTGYKVVRIPLRNGNAYGEYEDFPDRLSLRIGRCVGPSRWRHH